MRDSSRVVTDVIVEGGGGMSLLDDASIGGDVGFQGASSGRILTTGSVTDVTVGPDASLHMFGDTRVEGDLFVQGTAVVVMHVRSANVPSGDVAASTGVVLARDLDGNAMSFAFTREPGTRLVVEIDSEIFAGTICSQPAMNGHGERAQLRRTRSRWRQRRPTHRTRSDQEQRCHG